MNHSPGMATLDELFAVCRRHAYEGGDVVVPEPYVPHFPKKSRWNGVLVLAIAQNLSDSSRDYRKWLQALEQRDRWNRLNLDTSPLDGIGIGPWDDGTMKLSVAALLGVAAIDRVAVSNAIVWSGRKTGSSKHLSSQVEEASVSFWADLLDALQPNRVLAFSRRAATVMEKVMKKAGVEESELISLPAPFSRNYSFSFKMDTDRLLTAFPEVASALRDTKKHTTIENEPLAIHCACASVSKMLHRKASP